MKPRRNGKQHRGVITNRAPPLSGRRGENYTSRTRCGGFAVIGHVGETGIHEIGSPLGREAGEFI